MIGHISILFIEPNLLPKRGTKTSDQIPSTSFLRTFTIPKKTLAQKAVESANAATSRNVVAFESAKFNYFKSIDIPKILSDLQPDHWSKLQKLIETAEFTEDSYVELMRSSIHFEEIANSEPLQECHSQHVSLKKVGKDVYMATTNVRNYLYSLIYHTMLHF